MSNQELARWPPHARAAVAALEVDIEAECEREGAGKPDEQLEERDAGIVLVSVCPVGHQAADSTSHSCSGWRR